MGGRPTAAPPEGRAWWLELQRQRAQAGSGTSSQPPGEAANAPAEGQHGDGLARRRTSLLRDSEALLRRMSRPIPQPSGSSLGDSHGTSASAAAATPPAGSPAAAPAPLQRSVSTRCSSLAGARDAGRAASSEEMHLLLEGGLIGRAMSASAAWHQTKAALQQQEQAEWKLLRGEALGGSPSSSAPTGAPAMPRAARAQQMGAARLLPLPVLEEGQPGEEEGQKAGGQQGGPGPGSAPQGAAGCQQPFDCDVGRAEALITAFADAEMREYLQLQLAAPASPACSHGGAAAAAAVAGASPEPSGLAVPAAPGAPSAYGSTCLGPDPFSTAATAGGDTGAATGYALDPVLAAWLVTRAPPDLPVRGAAAPPGRAACRLAAAQEMREFYERERRRQGCFFKHLGLALEQAGGRGSGGAPMQLAPAEPAAAPAPHKTLKGLVKRNMLLRHVGDLAQQSKAAVWARERSQRSEAEAAQRLQQQRQDAVAAQQARAAAAAAAARRAQAGPHAGNAFAAVVQLAKERQAGPAGSGAAAGGGSPARAEPKTAKALPALQLQKLTERWHRAAAASVAAAGEQTARQRREAASRLQLKQQWGAVKGRLPEEA